MSGWLTRWGGKLAAWSNPGEAARVYAAAGTTISTGTWQPVSSTNVNDIISADAATIRARVRQLTRDMPHAARAVQVLTDYTVGRGIQPQPHVLDRDGKTPLRSLNRAIEEAWKRWNDEADAAGRLSFNELQTLAKRGETETGEFFFRLRVLPSGSRWLPLALQAIEPDQVEDVGVKAPAGSAMGLSQGVLYATDTGAPVAYYLTSDDLTSRAVRLPAAQVVHGFQALRPGQLRGVSPLAPAVLLTHSLRDFLEAEIDSARLAARYLAFVTSPDPASTMAAFGATTSADYTDSTGTRPKLFEELGTAIKEYLAPGEDVKFADHSRPGDQFRPFVQFVLQTIAAVTGVSYELLSGDYQGLNYSVLRGVRNDLAKQLEVHQQRLVRQLCRPVYHEFLRWAVLTKRVEIPDYFSDPWRYQRVGWLGPGMYPVDPLKEGRADADAVAARLKSPVEAIRARGRDPEDVLDELAEFEALAKERGVTTPAGAAAAALAGNPAALLSADPDDPDDTDDTDDPAERRLC